ncbi:MAG: OadG family protein [Bacteroidales bacterium]|jgi:Na+-transporting methylmalonyl-CoA/oxaloacetate decarboxylase gamma subunit|nr:OadG family protein [Bacteroidales bacterium]
MTLLAIDWSGALDIVWFGFGMTVCILLLLVFLIGGFGKLVAPRVRVPKATATPSTVVNSKEKNGEFVEEILSAEASAAIAMALHLYYDEAHDKESEIITIKSVMRRYSPWSSKIYGLNNYLPR